MIKEKIREFVIEQKCVPWRVSHEYEMWLEGWVSNKIPLVYRLISFGRLKNIVFPLTDENHHHFFGYYEKNPWNFTGRYHLSHRVNFINRPPGPKDTAMIGMSDTESNGKWIPLVETHAWNWQQGAMLRWHPMDENVILFNDQVDDQYVGVSLKVDDGQRKQYERPFYAVSPDGKWALSLNFSRLHENRPGYGYAGVSDPYRSEDHPKDDGIFYVDLLTGKSHLIISLDQLRQIDPVSEMSGVKHWINHIQISPTGKRFGFFHIWFDEKRGWYPRLFTANSDGSELCHLISGGVVSHYDWRDDKTILIWAYKHPCGECFLLLEDRSNNFTVVGEGILTGDGHCSYSPDRKWILNDTYPDWHSKRTLMLFNPEHNQRIDLERFYSPKECGEIRCDLHPRWHPNGKMVSIDSVHEGFRRVYLVDVSKWCLDN